MIKGCSTFQRHDWVCKANWRRSRRLAAVEGSGSPFLPLFFDPSTVRLVYSGLLDCGKSGWKLMRARERGRGRRNGRRLVLDWPRQLS